MFLSSWCAKITLVILKWGFSGICLEMTVLSNISHVTCSKLLHNMHSNNCTTVKRQQFINTWQPTCFGLQLLFLGGLLSNEIIVIFGSTAPSGPGPPHYWISISHTPTHHSRQDSSGRVISPSRRPLPDITQHSQQTNVHARGGIRTHNLSRRAAGDLRLRPRGQWDGPNEGVVRVN